MKRCIYSILIYIIINCSAHSQTYIEFNISDKTVSSINAIATDFINDIYDKACVTENSCKEYDKSIPLTLKFGKNGESFSLSNNKLEDMKIIKQFYDEIDNYKLYVDLYNSLQLQTEDLQNIIPECEIKDYMIEKNAINTNDLCNLFFNCYDKHIQTSMAFYINAKNNDLVCIRKNDDSAYLWYYKTKNGSFAKDIMILSEKYSYHFQCEKASYCIEKQDYDTDKNCNCVLQAKEFLLNNDICSGKSCKSNDKNIENHYEGRDGKLYHKKDNKECKK
ncbi:hypothetical protein HDR60_05010 [bacterium]|nr:hypothetical protein [bacterium]